MLRSFGHGCLHHALYRSIRCVIPHVKCVRQARLLGAGHRPITVVPPALYVTRNVPSSAAVAPPSEQVTVAVEVPAPVLVPTVQVQETPPDEPATG
jgi:hypothetical protein